jgi:hypothetical protein
VEEVMAGADRDRSDFEFFDFDGHKVRELRILPPLIDAEAEAQIIRTFKEKPMKITDGVKLGLGLWLFKLLMKLGGAALFILVLYLLSR